MNLSTRERNLIKSSWKLLKSEAGISNQLIFYEAFFKKAPDAYKYFKKKNGQEVDFKKLTRKFTYTMDFIVDKIDEIEHAQKEIMDLGSLHNKLKIDPKFYPLFNQALIELLDELLGSRSSEDLRIAWTKALSYITNQMQAALIKESNGFQKILNKLFGNH